MKRGDELAEFCISNVVSCEVHGAPINLFLSQENIDGCKNWFEAASSGSRYSPASVVLVFLCWDFFFPRHHMHVD